MNQPFELSNELLDIICSFVDRPSDLLALALTSKSLRDVVVPDHIQYRFIRCGSVSARLWQELTNRPRLVCHIRDLEICTIDPETVDLSNSRVLSGPIVPLEDLHTRIPDDTRSATYGGALADAIKLMPYLRRIHWSPDYWYTPISAALLNAVSTRPSIQEIELLFHRDEIAKDPPLLPLLDSISSLQQLSANQVKLRRFSFTVKAPADHSPGGWDTFRRLAEVLTDLLASFRSLEDLQIYVEDAGYWPMFSKILGTGLKKSELPDLKRLNIQASPLIDIEEEFFSAHRKLSALTMHDQDWDGREMNYSSLPMLRALEMAWVPTLYGYDFPVAVAGNLHHTLIRLHKDDLKYLDNELDDSFYLHKTASLRSLVIEVDHRLAITCDVFLNMLHPLVNLTRLALLSTDISGDSILLDHRYLVGIFKALPKLTHFYALHLAEWGYDPYGALREVTGSPGLSDDDEASPALSRLVPAASKLRYIAVKYQNQESLPTWLTIKRDGHGSYVGYERTPGRGYEKETNIDLWGDCYRGVHKRTTRYLKEA